jgi:C-terminal peptidase prc
MRRLTILACLVLTACNAPTGTTTTTAPISIGPTVVSTSQPPPLEYEVQNCAAPPVTFSALCEVYELTQEWHVDRPVPDQVLAEVALAALQGFSSDDHEEPPRKLICAVPTEAFYGFCAHLATMVDQFSIPIGAAVDSAVVAMADIGLDPFSYYVPPDQVGSFRENGVVGGIGVLLDARDAAGSRCVVLGPACPLGIVFVLEDNPGSDAGLMAGDEITAIDGQPVDGQGFVEITGQIAGDETGSVSITYVRNGHDFEVAIDRSEISVPTVTVDLPEPGVGYLRIPDFEDDIPELVSEALRSLSEYSPSTIVIDLRDNPGGFIDSAVAVASEFIDGGVVLNSVGPGEEIEYPATVEGLATTEALIVIVNGGTASAAEILAAALRDERAAIIVGTTTFGKDAIQIPFDLRNGGEFYVAVARWFSPNGESVRSGGLVADRELALAPGLSNKEIVRAALDATS